MGVTPVTAICGMSSAERWNPPTMVTHWSRGRAVAGRAGDAYDRGDRVGRAARDLVAGDPEPGGITRVDHESRQPHRN